MVSNFSFDCVLWLLLSTEMKNYKGTMSHIESVGFYEHWKVTYFTLHVHWIITVASQLIEQNYAHKCMINMLTVTFLFVFSCSILCGTAKQLWSQEINFGRLHHLGTTQAYPLSRWMSTLASTGCVTKKWVSFGWTVPAHCVILFLIMYRIFVKSLQEKKRYTVFNG